MATLTLTLGASADDASLDDGAYNDTDTAHTWGGVGTAPNTNFGYGHRFTNVTLDSTAVVTSAHLLLMKSGTAAGVLEARLTCISESNTATFSSGSPPGARAIVSNIAQHSDNVTHTDGVVYAFPTDVGVRVTLGAAVQEVLALGGWANSNAIGVVTNSDQDASAYQTFARKAFHWWDSGTASSEPQFVIDYLPAVDQEGARFRNDDGSETTATWAATQDTNLTAPLSTNLRLRVLVDAPSSDPAAIAYTLRAAKNAGVYTAVPVGATSAGTQPLIEAGDCTVSGNNTAQATWAVSHPAAATGDLLIFYIAWDDSTNTTDVAEPTGPNGETLTEINATPITDSSTETRAKAWYCKATGSWSASTVTFTPSATEQWSATVVKVLAGEFDSTTPIGTTGTRAATGVADTAARSVAMTAGSSDGGGTLLWFAGVDTDPLTGTIAGWTNLQTQDLGAVAHGVRRRDAAVTNSESIAGGDSWTIAGDSWTSIGVIVRAPVVTNGLYVATSANITAGGEATTAQLTAPSGKTTGDFVTGRMWDNENGTDTIDITSNDYTELEWCLNTQSPTVNGDTFDFRVYQGTSAFSTYSVTPRWTIGTPGGASIVPLLMAQYRARR